MLDAKVAAVITVAEAARLFAEQGKIVVYATVAELLSVPLIKSSTTH
jgi:hypothetical protein